MIYQSGPLQWIESNGGPLILLPAEYLTAWSGYNPSEQSRNGLRQSRQTDYERACAVEGYTGILRVDGGQGLVLGDEPMATAWWPATTTQGIFVRWVTGEEQTSAIHHLTRLAEEIWEPSNTAYIVGRRPLYLFDVAWPGTDAPERLVVRLAAGSYTIDTAHIQPDHQTEFVLHRLRRVGA